MVEKFWMIWNPGNMQPRVQHESLESAKLEAERLARKHPGEDYIVLESVGKARCELPVDWKTF